VVAEDHPQAIVEQVDAKAARLRVRPGMRYATALQLARDLRAAPVSERVRREAQAEILAALHARTPRVEPDRERDGVFWLDPSGLGGLFGPLERWAANVLGAVEELGLRGAIVVGFGRLPSWAIARTRRGPFVLESPAEEARLAARAPLVRLGIPAEVRDALLALGVDTLGGFLALPRGEVGVRFGSEARALHARFADALRDPLSPVAFEEPIVMEAELEPPDDDATRLLFCIKGAMHALMAELARRSLALAALTLTFELERHDPHRERIEAARASRDALSLLELVRLRLATVRLPSRVERIVVEAEPARLDGTQLAMFAQRQRDPGASGRAIARLRAAFGDTSVTRAALEDGWLPENAFAWQPTERVDAPEARPEARRQDDGDAPGEAPTGRLVRRVLPRPRPLPVGADGRPRLDPPLDALVGPYRLQGGWWVREAARDYFFAERRDGALLWLFRDRRRGGWFLHGQVD
jgi:protein ImuB